MERREGENKKIIGGRKQGFTDPINMAVTLPCGHVLRPACVNGLRSFGVKLLSPMFRTELPPGPG